jgi:nanoRNase/pAp phosphatase (c-di-AMP/oligoRNAs hydrolase)
LINTTKEAKAAILLYETLDGKIKGSLRTEDSKIDVSTLAKKLLGGGHKKASGFSFSGRIVRENDRFKIV